MGYGDVSDIDPRLAPTYIQEVTKTLTLALAPFVPFSQKYTMELREGQGGDLATGAPSFFTITPTEMYYPDKPWEQAIDAYTSRNNITIDEMDEKAPNVDHLLTPMAQKLTALLDAMPAADAAHTRQFEGSVIGELVGEHSMETLREVMEKGGHEIGGAPAGLDEAILKETSGGLSTETFDLFRDDSSEPFFKSQELLFDDLDMDRVVAAEVTDSWLKKEIVTRSMKGKDVETSIELMEKQTDKIYGKINDAMKKMVEKLEIKGSRQEILKEIHAQDKWTSKEAGYWGASNVSNLGRQFADRFFRLEGQKAINPEQDSYLYTLPLGDTGWMAALQLGVLWTQEGDFEYPSIDVIARQYAEGQGDAYYFINLLQSVNNKLGLDDAIINEEILKGIIINATNDLQHTDAKAQTADWSYASIIDNILSPDAHVDMWKAKKGETQGAPRGATVFTSSEMAEMLATQFEALGTSNAGEEFAEAWKEIFAESNQATGLWKDEVTAGQEDFDFVKGISDPARQGIWSKNAAQTWHPERNPTRGINVSMAPAIFSQAGRSVARFTPKDMSKYVPAQFDDPKRGVKAGDKVKAKASFLPTKPASAYGTRKVEGGKDAGKIKSNAPSDKAYGHFIGNEMPSFL